MAKRDMKADVLKARDLLKQGKIKQAGKLLQYHKDHPKVKPLYDKAVEKYAPIKAKAKKRNRNIMIAIALAFVFLCGGLYAYQQVTVSDFILQIKWRRVCTSLAIDAIVYGDSGIEFTDAVSEAYQSECDRQAAYQVAINRDELAYCYWNTERASLDIQFQECLAENDAYIDGTMLGLAINAAQ